MDIMIIIVAIAAIAVLGYMLMAADKKNSQLAASVQAMAAAKAAAEAQLAAAGQSAADAQRALDESRAKAEALARQLADERARTAALGERVEQAAREQQRLQEQSRLVFREVAAQVLADQSKAASKQQADGLAALLTPMREQIDGLRRQMGEYSNRQTEYAASMKQQIKDLNDMNASLGREAKELSQALRGESKVQGDWGEMVLQKLLENSGLVEGQNFVVQATEVDGQPVQGDRGTRLRPDVVLLLPDKKNLVIDSKTSLTAYAEYSCANTDAERQLALKRHVDSVRKHVAELADKTYQDRVSNSAGFVMMFIPNEAAYLLAMGSDAGLWQYAYDRQVVIVSPTHLISVLKLVSQLWTREMQTRNAMKIAEETGKLYDKLAAFVADMQNVEKSLDNAKGAWSEAMKKLSGGRGNVLSRFETIKKLGIKASKQLPSVPDGGDGLISE